MTTPDTLRLHATRAPPRDTDTDRAWIAAVRASDSAAFEAIFRVYNRHLHRFALKLLGSADEAEDAVQGVFVAIWEHRATWSVQGSLRAYLFTAVRNRALHQLRARRTRDRLQAEVLAFTTRAVSEAFLGPDAQVHHHDFAAALQAAIDALPPRAREAFLLTREHGLSYEEVGAAMGISPKTVMVHIGRALIALRTAVGPFLTLLAVLR